LVPAIGETVETLGVSWYLYVTFVFETPPGVVTSISLILFVTVEVT